MARKVGALTIISISGKSSGASGKAILPTPDPMSHKVASCSMCRNRTDEEPPFCTWLNAEIPVDLADDPECEGFALKVLRTSEAGTGFPQSKARRKGDDKRVGELRPPPIANPPETSACPKALDKSLIQAALKFKGFNGSVVMEKICCGKPGCHCQRGALHGPYPYLHFWQDGKVRRRYLSKSVSALMSHSTEELEKMLHETDALLGQEEKDPRV